MGVIAETQEQLKALVRLYEREDYDFWISPSLNESTNILITPEQRTKFQRFLNKFNLKGQVVMDDVYRYANLNILSDD